MGRRTHWHLGCPRGRDYDRVIPLLHLPSPGGFAGALFTRVSSCRIRRRARAQRGASDAGMSTVGWSQIRHLWGIFSLHLRSVARAPRDPAQHRSPFLGSPHCAMGFFLGSDCPQVSAELISFSLPLHLLRAIPNIPKLHHWGRWAAPEGSACFTSFFFLSESKKEKFPQTSTHITE